MMSESSKIAFYLAAAIFAALSVYRTRPKFSSDGELFASNISAMRLEFSGSALPMLCKQTWAPRIGIQLCLLKESRFHNR